MVQRIADAARRVLVEDGYDQFSANRIAVAAGISPGSLYQYFPNKQAILDVVLDDYWEDLATRVEASLTERVDQFDPEGARAVIDALLTALEADPVLLGVILQDGPQARMRSQAEALGRRIRDLAAAALRLYGAAEDRDTAATKAWMAVVAIESLATRWVLDTPPVPRERFLDEMVVLVTRYLGVS